MRALVSQLILPCLLFIFFISSALATPLPHTHPLLSSSSQLVPRDHYILRNNTLTGELHAINPDTLELIPQGPATDGSGKDLNAPAVIWMVFALLVGVPLSFSGYRGWRMTTGVGIGLAATLACELQHTI